MRRPEPCSVRPEPCSVRPEPCSGRPEPCSVRPERSEPCLVRTQSLVLCAQSPVLRTRRPVLRAQRPVLCTQRPVLCVKSPVLCTQSPLSTARSQLLFEITVRRSCLATLVHFTLLHFTPSMDMLGSMLVYIYIYTGNGVQGHLVACSVSMAATGSRRALGSPRPLTLYPGGPRGP